MADYPSRVMSGGSIISARSASVSRILQGGSLGYTARFSSIGYRLLPSIFLYGLSSGRGQVINSIFPNVQSLERIYFNNGFSQDSQNIYLSKSALGLPSGLNLSLEAFFVACLIQWVTNIKTGSEQKIVSQYLSYADKQGNYVYFTIEVTFREESIDEYE